MSIGLSQFLVEKAVPVSPGGRRELGTVFLDRNAERIQDLRIGKPVVEDDIRPPEEVEASYRDERWIAGSGADEVNH